MPSGAAQTLPSLTSALDPIKIQNRPERPVWKQVRQHPGSTWDALFLLWVVVQSPALSRSASDGFPSLVAENGTDPQNYQEIAPGQSH